MNGIFNLYKPSGPSSNRFLSLLKKRFSIRKMGHLGTLDPLAEGVLPVFTGKMTKLVPFFNGCDKSYRVRLRFGVVSDTYDIEGELHETQREGSCSENSLKDCLRQMQGEMWQKPPAFSAVKIKGKRAYRYAREGLVVDLEARKVVVYRTKLEKFGNDEACFSIDCSKGFYVRSYVHELGERIGCGAVMTGLERTACGKSFNVGNSVRLDLDEKKADEPKSIKAMDPFRLLADWNILTVHDPKGLEHISHGRSVPAEFFRSEFPLKPNVAAFAFEEGGNLLSSGVLECSQERPLNFHPQKVLL